MKVVKKIGHLKDDNLVDNEMSEVIPSKDIKMANQVDEAFRGDDKIKMAKEVEIKIDGNDKDRKILELIKTNLNAITCFDHLFELYNSGNYELFISSLPGLLRENEIQGMQFFNQIILSKLTPWLLWLNSQNIEENSTECSSIGDEDGENGPFN